ncbi:MAG: hypothetical protein NZ920_00940 [Aigarchaeota archaeon]|nr:hypothetical protein [Aigarchaeota archaeon]MDW8093008.1 hypothetical protein [Nitrososphaerota archaeon]
MRAKQVDTGIGWRLLLDVTRLERIDPWKIKLVDLLNNLELVVSVKEIGLATAGVAILSASFLHRKKSERLFEFDRPPQPEVKPDLTVPPPLEIPMKASVITTTLLDVVEALRSVLSDVSDQTVQSTVTNLDAGLKLDDYLMKLEEEVEGFFELLASMLSDKDHITFRDLILNADRLEAAKRFILVLIAAARGRVELYQDEETGEIIIKRSHA